MNNRRRLRLAQLQLEIDDAQNAAVAAAQQQAQQAQQQRRRRRWWTRPWLLRRPAFGQFEQLMVELRLEDPASFTNFVRFQPDMFQELVDRLTRRIAKKDTNWRNALDPGLKVAITLRSLATGDTSKSLMYGFRVAYNTICLLIRDVCDAIVREYQEEVITTPTTRQGWRRIADVNSRRWQFHHCLGALDGKHVVIKKPRGGGSYWYNYKGFHSIVLMALVDGSYKFVWAEVGTQGTASDAQIFDECELKEGLDAGVLGIPPADRLPHDDRNTEYFIIGDDAFALRTYMMKPYGRIGLAVPERVFNYRICRCRRVSENGFGILANRFGCLLTTIKFQPKVVVDIVMAAICLHNLMRMRFPGAQNAVMDRKDDNHNLIPGEWSTSYSGCQETELQKQPSNRDNTSSTTTTLLQEQSPGS